MVTTIPARELPTDFRRRNLHPNNFYWHRLNNPNNQKVSSSMKRKRGIEMNGIEKKERWIGYRLQVFEEEVADEGDVEALVVSGDEDAVEVGWLAGLHRHRCQTPTTNTHQQTSLTQLASSLLFLLGFLVFWILGLGFGVLKGEFTLKPKPKKTPKLSAPIGWEPNFGPKEFTLGSESKVLEERSGSHVASPTHHIVLVPTQKILLPIRETAFQVWIQSWLWK